MPASTIKSSKGDLKFSGQNDSRGNPIYIRSDGAKITKQGDKLVLSALARTHTTGDVTGGLPQSEEGKQALGALKDYLDTLEATGASLNPNIKIDDETLAKFYEQAEREVDPFFQQIITRQKEDLNEYISITQANSRDDAAVRLEAFDRRLEGIQENLAATGQTFSGERRKTEKDLRVASERDAAAAQRSTQSQVRSTVRRAEDSLGSKNLEDINAPDFSRPTFGRGSTDSTSNRVIGTADSPLFQLSPGVTGQIEEDQKVAVEERVGQLESAERRRRATQEIQDIKDQIKELEG